MKKGKEIEVYVDLTDYNHEIGEGNAPGPHQVYNTLDEIIHKKPCAKQCGVVRVKLVKQEIVRESNYIANIEHSLSFSEKYGVLIEALIEIRNTVECSQALKKIADVALKKVL